MTVLEQIPATDEVEGIARILNGAPYILVTVIGNGQVDLTFAGFTPDQVVSGLRELADQLSEQVVNPDDADDERQW